jgi:hypothetical protein
MPRRRHQPNLVLAPQAARVAKPGVEGNHELSPLFACRPGVSATWAASLRCAGIGYFPDLRSNHYSYYACIVPK